MREKHIFLEKNRGLAWAPTQPHTTRPEVQPCHSCHEDPKVLGLGKGMWQIRDNWQENRFLPIYDSKGSGLPFSFGLESLLSEKGEQQQGVSHLGARPFLKEELKKILRVSLCLPCHDAYDDPVYQFSLDESVKRAKNNPKCPWSRDQIREGN